MEGVTYNGLVRPLLAGLFFLCALLLMGSMHPITANATTGVNTEIPFSGNLNDDKGKPLTGSYDMVFHIYDAGTGGNILWTGNYTLANGNQVSVSDGVFRVMLGSGTGNELTLDFNDDTYYLGLTVATDPEMTPRERLGASGYAINADMLDGLHASAFLRDDESIAMSFATSGPVASLTQLGTGNILELFNSSGNVLSVLANGNVGIGTTTPSYTFAVEGSGYFKNHLRLSSTTMTNATSTTFSTSLLGVGADYLSDITGNGLSLLDGALTVATSTFFTNSLQFSGWLDDEEGSGSVVFSHNPTFTGSATFGDITSGSFTGTSEETSTFAGSITVQSTSTRSVFEGMVQVGDGYGILLGSESGGVIISQKIAQMGTNDILLGLTGTDAIANGYVNIAASSTLSFTANAGPDGSGQYTPSLELKSNGMVTIANYGHGELQNQYLKVDFANGISLPRGNVRLGSGSHFGATEDDPDAELHVMGPMRSSSLEHASGLVSLSADADGNIILSASDGNLKKNIRTIDDGLEKLLDIRGVRYEWKDSERFGEQTEIGFIAQELLPEIPEVVREGKEYLSVNTQNIVAIVVEAIKEMHERMEEYFTRTERLEREVEELRNLIENLKEETNATDTEQPPYGNAYGHNDTEEADEENDANDANVENESNGNGQGNGNENAQNNAGENDVNSEGEASDIGDEQVIPEEEDENTSDDSESTDDTQSSDV